MSAWKMGQHIETQYRNNDVVVWLMEYGEQWYIQPEKERREDCCVELSTYHRDDGPAIIWYDEDAFKLHCDFWDALNNSPVSEKYRMEEWYLYGQRVTDEINEWCIRKSLPNWRLWTSAEKILFKLTFAGK